MFALAAARGRRIAGIAGGWPLLLPSLFVLSCSDDNLMVPAVPPPAGTTIEWSYDALVEGFAGIVSTPDGVTSLGERTLYRLGATSWDPLATGIPARDYSVSQDGDVFALDSHVLSRKAGDHWVKYAEFTGYFHEALAVWAWDSKHVFVATTDYDENWGFTWYSLLEYGGDRLKGHALPGTAADIWGSSAEDVFVVGSAGMVVHFDGVTAITMEGVTGNNLRGVWGQSATDVYAVGDQGKVVHFDGLGWSSYTRPTQRTLYVARLLDDRLVVAGARGACYRYAGGAWEDLSVPIAGTITGLVGDGNGVMFASTSSGMLRFENGSWRYVIGAAGEERRAIWCAANGDVVAVGAQGVIEQRDADGWRPAYAGEAFDQWNAVSGTSASDIYAVGLNGKLAHFDGVSWTLHPSGTGAHLSAVWASADRIVIANRGSIREWANDASVPMPGAIPAKDILDLWGSSGDDIYAVGASGLLLHFDGLEWSEIETGLTRPLYGVWGTSASDVFVAGAVAPFDGPTRYYAATILHYDGKAWSRMPAEDIPELHAIWGYDSENVIVLAPASVGYFDGRAWVPQRIGRDNEDFYMRDIYGVPGGDAFAVDGSGIIRLSVKRGAR